MGAECDKHGVDLHGDTFSGLVCPSCELEAERDKYRERAEELERGLASVRAFLLDPDLPVSDSLERVCEELEDLDPDFASA